MDTHNKIVQQVYFGKQLQASALHPRIEAKRVETQEKTEQIYEDASLQGAESAGVDYFLV